MAQLTIRTARSDERSALEALQWRASLHDSPDRDVLLAHPDAIELPLQQIEAAQVFVAEVAGSIQGFVVMLPRDDGDVELDGLFVEPHAWGQGVGRALVEYCVQRAGATHAAALHVLGSPYAEGFYVRCGFKKQGIKETRFGFGLLMRLEFGSGESTHQGAGL